MRQANNKELSNFKNNYCTSEDKRNQMFLHFNVEVETFEDLLPGRKITSYATGSRDIEDTFFMFKVTDTKNGIEYFPAFSETVGRKMLKTMGIKVPRKRSVFVNITNNTKSEKQVIKANYKKEDKTNVELRHLILFSYYLISSRFSNPRPMNSVLRELYCKLANHPFWKVRANEIKSVNTCIKHYITKETNTKNENYSCLNDFIKYLEFITKDKRLISIDFSELRKIMRETYPNEEILF